MASTATGWTNKEGEILRYVFWHSLVLACLVGVLVRPVQFRAQLAGPALDLLGACLCRVRLFLGGGQLAAQLVGFAACGRFGGLDGRQAGLQGFHVAGQFVGQLGCLVAVGF